MKLKTTVLLCLITSALAFGGVRNHKQSKREQITGYQLDFLLSKTKNLVLDDDNDKEHIEELIFYTKESDFLEKTCSQDKKIAYENVWQKIQVKRTLLASLQSEILKKASRYFAYLAQRMDLKKEEYDNSVQSIVSYCSPNMTVISHKRLIKELTELYSDHLSSWDSLGQSTFYAKEHQRTLLNKDLYPKLFVETASVIKSACSWDGDPEREQSIYNFISNPSIAAYIIDQVSMGKRSYDIGQKKMVLTDHKAPRIYCDDFVCREKNWIYFYSKTPKSLGYSTLKSDYQKLYCQEFYRPSKPLGPKEKNTLSQLYSIFFNVPNFPLLLRSQKHFDILVESSFRQRLSNWSQFLLKDDIESIPLEESLNLKLIAREQNLLSKEKDIEVQFDLNYGEMDKSIEKVGKVSTFLEHEFKSDFIRWAQIQWAIHQANEKSKKDPIIKAIQGRIEDKVSKMLKSLDLRVTYGSFARQASIEILDQLILGYGRFDGQDTKLKLVLSYSPFALKYLRKRKLRESAHRLDKSR